MKLNLKDIDAVYKKIDKKLDELLRENDYMSAFDLLDIAINRAPSIPAVPLDKLCEWLAENNMNIPCASCQHMQNDYCTAIGDMSKPCPKDADDWRKALTNWMEGLDAAD